MKNLVIEMTEAELFALDIISSDKQTWADNVLTNRARVAKEELKSRPEWAQAVAIVAKAGGDVSDDWAVLLAGRDSTPPLFETAATIQARNEAKQADLPDPTPPNPLDRALTRKQLRMGLVKFGGKSASFVTDMIAAMPDGEGKDVATIDWEDTKQYERNHPLIVSMGATAGFTEAEIDSMWIASLDLPV